MPQSPQAYTVTAITRMIKGQLESNFQSLWIEGEISNYLHHSSGHRYFFIKDDHAVLKVTLWRSIGQSLKFEPENGQKVLVRGDITVYEKGGQYQLNCRKLMPVGVGELELAFRQLREKLEAEGLFDDRNKTALPRFPRKIGLVTSPTSAAVRDMIRVSHRRNRSIELVIYPAQVQGEGAEKTIAAGLEYFNSRSDIDLIITGRGGGSIEDLWAFNTEITVRAIAESKLPIISGVGHEIDLTLADLAADLRAATPSAAAELAVWSADDFKADLDNYAYTMASLMKNRYSELKQSFEAICSRPVWKRPEDMILQKQQQLDSLSRMMIIAGKNHFERLKNDLSLRLSRLDDLSPLRVLARGYSVTRTYPDGKLVRSTRALKPKMQLETVLTDGRLISTVNEILKEKPPGQ